MKKIFNKLKKNNIKAIKNNDVPVSCVIIKNNAIISASYNKKNKKNNPLCHAEINAIIKAARITKSWNLNDCNLYVTLEPCEMCKRVIEEARIKNVYYILNNDKKVNNTTQYIKINVSEEKYFKEELKTFFRKIRERIKYMFSYYIFFTKLRFNLCVFLQSWYNIYGGKHGIHIIIS